MQNGPWNLVWRLARSEGLRSVWERAADRLAADRRRRAFPAISVHQLDRTPEVQLPDPWQQILGDASPAVLNVLATPPRPDLGGVQTQFALRFEAELRRRPGALLFPSGDGYRLELSGGSGDPDAMHRLAIHWPGRRTGEPAEPAPDELARVLREAAELAGAKFVHVEQPFGLPLDVWRHLGRPLVVSLHDFGMFCRRPHLLERPQMEFCHFCRDDARCVACLGHSWPTRAGDQERRRAACRSMLEQAEALVFPSDFLRRTYLRLYPSLHAARTHVVAPPSHRPALPAATPRREIRRGAFVGSVRPHKGSEVFEQIVTPGGTPVDAPAIRWHAFGGGDPSTLQRLRRRGVEVHGYYRSGSLAVRLRKHRIDLALVLSVWPETYCMVVDECLHAGVPVLAFDLGAPAERLADAGGILVPPRSGARGVLEAVESMAKGHRPIPEVAADGLPTPASAADAVSKLYAEF